MSVFHRQKIRKDELKRQQENEELRLKMQKTEEGRTAKEDLARLRAELHESQKREQELRQLVSDVILLTV